MANKKNLVPQAHKLTVAEQSNGGKASGVARRRKKEIRECLEALLDREIRTKSGETMTGAEAISAKLFEKALRGDVRAFEVLRDSAGQKPVERVQVAEVDQSTIEEIERLWDDKGAGDTQTEN